MNVNELKHEAVKAGVAEQEGAILVGFRGSVAHNTYVPPEDENSTDDIDVMSVVIPPLETLFGLDTWGSRNTKEVFVGRWDCVSYTLQKFVGLLVKGNPNVMSLLYLPEELYIDATEEGGYLVAHRGIFLSKKSHFAFAGYAKDQLSKLEKQSTKGYMGKKRKQLFEKYGYDCKNASHLIRLLRMNKEFLNEGVYNVFREQDAQELIDIKTGKWTLDEVKKEAVKLFEETNNAYERAEGIPDECNMDEVNELLVFLTKRYHGWF